MIISSTTTLMKSQEIARQQIFHVAVSPSRRIIQVVNILDEYGHTVEKIMAKDDIDIAYYFLSFPYLIFSIRKTNDRIQNIRLAFATKLDSDCPKLYLPPLDNCFAQHLDICMPFRDVEQPIGGIARAVVEQFWKTVFNRTEGDARFIYRRQNLPLASYKKWHKKTKEDPLWIPGPTDLIELNLLQTEDFWHESVLQRSQTV